MRCSYSFIHIECVLPACTMQNTTKVSVKETMQEPDSKNLKGECSSRSDSDIELDYFYELRIKQIKKTKK